MYKVCSEVCWSTKYYILMWINSSLLLYCIQTPSWKEISCLVTIFLITTTKYMSSIWNSIFIVFWWNKITDALPDQLLQNVMGIIWIANTETQKIPQIVKSKIKIIKINQNKMKVKVRKPSHDFIKQLSSNI